jgi:hypothetical protein
MLKILLLTEELLTLKKDYSPWRYLVTNIQLYAETHCKNCLFIYKHKKL